jgi:WhiB family redox-sensing transcriptional regulator
MSISYENVPWKQSACATAEDVDFYPEPGREYSRKVMEAKAVCKECPIKMQCLEYALSNEDYGIWGGLGPAEREAMRRRSYGLKGVATKRRLNIHTGGDTEKLIKVAKENNERRAKEAASATINILKEALDAVSTTEILDSKGRDVVPDWVKAARLRIDNPTASLIELAQMANMSKDAYSGKLRRLISFYKTSK